MQAHPSTLGTSYASTPIKSLPAVGGTLLPTQPRRGGTWLSYLHRVAPSTILTPPDPQCPSAQEAARLSPSSQSRFTTIRLEALWKRCPNGKPDKKDTERLRILVYINYLITFRRPHKLAADSLAHRLGLDKDSPAIVDGILSRSTETINQTDGSLTHNLTSFSTIKLYSCITYAKFDPRRLDDSGDRAAGRPTRTRIKYQRHLPECGVQDVQAYAG
ncbi:hypothetical protein PTTG_03269 [Puccinia triticina 1-1 BBBD Race 1]|uniref:Uncharacterized protein n=1 Tax=Puccinia triticina (isolate 1-1 / race 1 (BBBD)) TaxID=630390 RepID=A0A180GJT3_PUCT1|nr:hypothetical protein PTTG_03269 [Puccinia triticina 1-1 BBBD Race 1]